MRNLTVELKTTNGMLLHKEIEYSHLQIDGLCLSVVKDDKPIFIFDWQTNPYVFDKAKEELHAGHLSLDSMWTNPFFLPRIRTTFKAHINKAIETVRRQEGEAWRDCDAFRSLSNSEINRMMEGKYRPTHLYRIFGRSLYVPKSYMAMGPTNFYKSLK